jgi:glycosyltransferase involved in cell wall biosynthesis
MSTQLDENAVEPVNARSPQAEDVQPPELSIVMPCLNESETLETCIRKARNWLEKFGIDGEVVVGDNGSTDGSQDIARRCGARVVDVPIRGYGAALYYATLAARGRYVIMGDSDDSYDFCDLMPFLEKLRADYDLVMGNRFKGGIKPGAMPWKNRYIGNPILSGIGRLFFRCPVRDFHCGLRGFSVEAFKKLDLRTTGMEYASEMVIKATLMGMKIADVPTTLSPDGRSRPPHLRPWRDGWRHLRFMLLYSPKWLFLYPGMALMLVGFLVGLWVWSGPQRVGNVVFDVHTLVYAAAAVLVGFQSVLFAFSSKIFAVVEGLLPPDPRLNRLFKYVNLEKGLIVGALLLFGGLGGTLMEVWSWGQQSFGPLDSSKTLRVVVPSALAMALGCQIIFSSFYFSLLGLRIRRLEGPGKQAIQP